MSAIAIGAVLFVISFLAAGAYLFLKNDDNMWSDDIFDDDELD
jgi:hypothetical protein